ncbi:MAG: hypothetical protein ACD_79C00604G0003, partial [uncultured bacterium]
NKKLEKEKEAVIGAAQKEAADMHDEIKDGEMEKSDEKEVDDSKIKGILSQEKKEIFFNGIKGKAKILAKALVLMSVLSLGEGDALKLVSTTDGYLKDSKIEKINKEKISLGKDYYLLLIKSDEPWRAMERINEYKNEPYAFEIIQIFLNDWEERHWSDSPWDEILNNIDKFIDQPYAQKVIEMGAENDSYAVLENLNKFINYPYAEEIVKKISSNESNAANIVYYAESNNYYKDLHGETDILKKAFEDLADAEPFSLLADEHNTIYYEDFTGRQEIINKAVNNTIKKHTSGTIYNYDSIINKPFAKEFIEKMIVYDPLQISWLQENNIKKLDLRHSDNANVKALINIDDELNNIKHGYSEHRSGTIKEPVFILSKKIIDGSLSVNRAIEMFSYGNSNSINRSAGSKINYYQYLREIRNTPNLAAEYLVSSELREAALRLVGSINELHDEPDVARFKAVENLKSNEIYELIVEGEDEVFTSTFNGLFNRMVEKMRKENIGGKEMLEGVGEYKFRTFIKMSASFNRLNEFLATMGKNYQKELLKKFVSDLEKERHNLSEVAAVADTLGILEDKEILNRLKSIIIDEYEKADNQILYGLFASVLKGRKDTEKDSWFLKLPEKYELPNLEKISAEKLFNKDGSNIQQHFFYNDKDGLASFENFLAQYKNNKDWRVEERGKYIRIISVEGNKKVEIFTNKPASEEGGPEEIEKIFKERNVQSIVVVHRGHSFHTDKTIEKITSIAKIVSLGSCGGYNNIDKVLQKSPDAHILSTKGIGTMLINDPLLKMLNEDIKSGNDINWQVFWRKAERKLGNNENFKNYIPPHKNLGVLFIKAYKNLKKDE